MCTSELLILVLVVDMIKFGILSLSVKNRLN